MKIAIVKGNYQRIENEKVLADRTAYFQLYLPMPTTGQTENMVTITRVKPNQLNIKPVVDSNGISGQGYFAQGTSRFNFHLIDSDKLKSEAKTFSELDNFSDKSVKWTVTEHRLNWQTPIKDNDKQVIANCNFCYSIAMEDLGKAISELKTFDNDIDLRDYIDSKVDKTEQSNTKRISKKRLIG